ncbi:hypothetical protein WAF17_07050 [Bernardetia sp. ABR2-2B]|uniref:hypothetical protein n=1 Tax=Bernardetia sp. ABR2-2B TaxID=3127472 RepID=UPI0030D3A62C
MKKTIRKIILRSLLCLFVAIASYFSYEIYLKDFIFEYFRMQVVDRMKENLENHESEFEELVEFSKDFNDIDDLQFFENDIINFRLRDSSMSSYIPNIDYESIWLTERNDSIFWNQGNLDFIVEKVEFNKDNFVKVYLNYEGERDIDTLHNWTINYRGTTNNIILKQLLTYRNIDFEKFKLLRNKVEKVNCHSFYKSGHSFMLSYAGYAPSDYFFYIISPNSPLSIGAKHLSKEDYYWCYHTSSFCIDMINWYGEGEVD